MTIIAGVRFCALKVVGGCRNLRGVGMGVLHLSLRHNNMTGWGCSGLGNGILDVWVRLHPAITDQVNCIV